MECVSKTSSACISDPSYRADVWPPPSPIQTKVGDRLHCVEVAVRPVDPLVDNVHSDSRGNAKSVLHQLNAVTAIHEGTFQPHILIGIAHVCEEHVAANARKYN